MAEVATPEQIAEYESQLAGIEQLLEASPGDESLLALKKDLVELLQLTKETTITTTENLELPPPPPLEIPPPPPPPISEGSSATAASSTTELDAAIAVAAAAGASATGDDEGDANESSITNADTTWDNNSNNNKPKKKKIKEFVVPPHLIVSETDSEAEKKRKRRALKALKNQWREKKKEVESTNRQKSWQSFQRKRGATESSSIFSTQEDVNDRVGVISKKQMTDFGARKRHKNS